MLSIAAKSAAPLAAAVAFGLTSTVVLKLGTGDGDGAGDPWGPAGPCGPEAPSGPEAPGAPSGPDGPTGPPIPAGPAQPHNRASTIMAPLRARVLVEGNWAIVDMSGDTTSSRRPFRVADCAIAPYDVK